MTNYYNTCLCQGGEKPGGTSTGEEVVEQLEHCQRKQLYYTTSESPEQPGVKSAIYPVSHASVIWYKNTGNSVEDVIGDIKTDIIELQKALQSQGKLHLRIADDCLTDSGVIALSARQGKALAEEMSTIKDSGYESLTKLDDYLYNVAYVDYRIEEASDFFDRSLYLGTNACSSFKKGNLVGHNFDGVYDNTIEFLVSTPHTFQRNAVLGISAGYIPTLTKEVVEDCAARHTYNEAFSIVPYTLVDGINEFGLSCSIHTVPADKKDSLGIGNKLGTVPTFDEGKVSIYSTLLPRYILDNFKTAEDAVAFLKDYASIKTPGCLLNADLDNHLFLADNESSYVVEWVPNEEDVWEVKVSENPALTNFYIDGVTFVQNKVYTPEEIVHYGRKPGDLNITDHAAGLERYNRIIEKLPDIEDKEDAMNLLLELFYTNIYNDVHAPFWYSDYATKADLTVNTPTTKSTWGVEISKAKETFAKRTRTSKDTMHTKHSIIYDLEAKELLMITQEDETKPISFRFEEYSKDDIDAIVEKINASLEILAEAAESLDARVTALEEKDAELVAKDEELEAKYAALEARVAALES